jgi:lysophospholipase L1-like esterase
MGVGAAVALLGIVQKGAAADPLRITDVRLPSSETVELIVDAAVGGYYQVESGSRADGLFLAATPAIRADATPLQVQVRRQVPSQAGFFRMRQLDSSAGARAFEGGIEDPSAVQDLDRWYSGLKERRLFEPLVFQATFSSLYAPWTEAGFRSLSGTPGTVHGLPSRRDAGTDLTSQDWLVIPNPFPSQPLLAEFSLFACFRAPQGPIGTVVGSGIPQLGPSLLTSGSPQQGAAVREMFFDYSNDGKATAPDYGQQGRRTFSAGNAGRPQTVLVSFSRQLLFLQPDLDRVSDNATPRPPAWNGNPTWTLGAWADGELPLRGTLNYVGVFSRALNESEHLSLRRLFLDTIGRTAGVPEVNLIVEGDSFSADSIPGVIGWDVQLADESNWRGRFSKRNVAVGGEVSGQVLAEFPDEVEPYAAVAARNYVFLWAGANDVYSGHAERVLQNLRDYWSFSRDAGFRVVAFTILKSGGQADGVEATRLALNDAIRMAGAEYDYLIDVANIPGLQDPTNPTYRLPDQKHLRTEGQALVAHAINLVIPNP